MCWGVLSTKYVSVDLKFKRMVIPEHMFRSSFEKLQKIYIFCHSKVLYENKVIAMNTFRWPQGL